MFGLLAVPRLWFSLLLLTVVILAMGCQDVSNSENVQTEKSQASKPQATSDSGLNQPSTQQDSSADKVAKTVSILIKTSEEVTAYQAHIAWQQSMTVFGATQAMGPGVGIQSTGQGETCFVNSLAGQENLGSAGHNWIFRVNGKLGDKSCDALVVQPGDQILWTFGKYE